MDNLSKYCIRKAVELGEPFYSVTLRRRGGREEKLAILHHSFKVSRWAPTAGGTNWPADVAFEGNPEGAITADGWLLLDAVRC